MTTCRTTLGAAAVAVLVLGGCDGPAPMPSISSPPDTTTGTSTSTAAATPTTNGTPRLDLDDDGSTVGLSVGGNATITLVDQSLQWGEPTVNGLR